MTASSVAADDNVIVRSPSKRSTPLPVKALVFSQWTYMLDIVEVPLRKKGIRFVRLDGSMSQDQRDKALRVFKTDDNVCVFLMSLKAGGLGLNLTIANYVYLLDPWWNPATEDQAINRAHRLGQTRPVIVRRLLARDSVEATILALQQRKQHLANSALAVGGGVAESANKLTLDDLKMFFQ